MRNRLSALRQVTANVKLFPDANIRSLISTAINTLDDLYDFRLGCSLVVAQHSFELVQRTITELAKYGPALAGLAEHKAALAGLAEHEATPLISQINVHLKQIFNDVLLDINPKVGGGLRRNPFNIDVYPEPELRLQTSASYLSTVRPEFEKSIHQSITEAIRNMIASEQVSLYELALEKKPLSGFKQLIKNNLLEKFSQHSFFIQSIETILDEELKKYVTANKLKKEIEDLWIEELYANKNMHYGYARLAALLMAESLCDNGVRSRALTTLIDHGVKIKSNEDNKIKKWRDLYFQWRVVDRYWQELCRIKERESLYPQLRRSIKDVSDLTKRFFQRLTAGDCLLLGQEGRVISNYEEEQIEVKLNALKSQARVIDRHLEKFRVQETKMLEKFIAPASYKAMASLESKNILDGIATMFVDYSSYNFIRFHWGRSHSAEAKEVVAEIMKFKTQGQSLKIVKDYLRGVLDRLILKDKLNVSGSFARRTHYCINLLEQKLKHEVPAELGKRDGNVPSKVHGDEKEYKLRAF